MQLIPINETNRSKIQAMMKKTCWNCHFMTSQAPFYCYKINKIRKKSHVCDEHRYFNPDQLIICGDVIRNKKRKKNDQRTN